MSQKNLPYIFLLLLIITLIFLGGVKYGQKVEEANKVIKYVLSITPTKSPSTPIPTRPINYQTYEFCNTSFLYPGKLEKIMVSETTTLFNDQDYIKTPKHTVLSISCFNPQGKIEKEFPETKSEFLAADIEGDIDISSQSASLKNKLSTSQFKLYKQLKDTVILKFIHPKTNYFIAIELNATFLPLIERTLEFTNSISPLPTKKPAITSIISP